jgi:hypothetical protein
MVSFSMVYDLTSFVDKVRRRRRRATRSQRVVHSHARIQFVSPLAVAKLIVVIHPVIGTIRRFTLDYMPSSIKTFST